MVIHYTAMSDCTAALARLCDPEAEVSAHYLIDYDGTTHALVAEDLRAWHAGAGSWRGQGDVNSRSIGIELANNGAEPFAHPQMRALEALLRGLLKRWAIRPQGVIAHSDMAPERKFDPGPRFDWARLARQGLALGALQTGNPKRPLTESLRDLGYPDAPPDALLRAFRSRFSPAAHGTESETDRALADALAQAARAPA